MKKCYTCDTDKDESEFGKRAASSDGLAHKCRECQRQYDKDRAMLPHRVKARLEYQKTEPGRSAINKAKKKWLNSNSIKRGAHCIVNNAIRDGRIEKKYFCEECGTDNCRIHGHHDDYAKPLEVRWLCSKCHTIWHKQNGEGANAS